MGPRKPSYALPQPCRLSPAPARSHHQGCLWSFAVFHPPLLTGLLNPSLRIGLRITAQHRWAAGCDRERSGLELLDLDLNPGSSPCPQALTWNKLFSEPTFSHLSGGNSGYTSKQYSHIWGMCSVLVVNTSCRSCWLQRCLSCLVPSTAPMACPKLLNSAEAGTRELQLLDQTWVT